MSARIRVRRPAKGAAASVAPAFSEGPGGLIISYYSESRGVVCVVDIRAGKFGGARVVHGVVHDYSRVARARRALRGARDMCSSAVCTAVAARRFSMGRSSSSPAAQFSNTARGLGRRWWRDKAQRWT